MKTRISFGILLLVALAATVATSAGPVVASLMTGPVKAALLTWPMIGVGLAAVGLHIVGHLVRSEKHALLLREIRPIGRRQVFRGQMIGLMADALLPLRIGEVMRAQYIGRAVQISRSAVFATIVFERTFDLVVIGVLGGVVALVLGEPANGTFLLVISFVAIGLAGLAASVLTICYRQPHWFLVTVHRLTGVLNPALCNRSRQVVWSFCHALTYALPSRRVLSRYVSYTLVMWAAYLGSSALLVATLLPSVKSVAAALSAAVVPFSGVTGWLGLTVFGQYASGVRAALAPWQSASDIGALTLAGWLLLIVPSVIVGAYCLLHRDLVEHIDGTTVSPLLRSKLYRDIDTSAEFAQLLATHFQDEQLSRIVSREEATGKFTVIRPLKGGSNASTLLVWQDDEIVVKKVTLAQYASKLQSQFDWLQHRAELSNLVNATGSTVSTDYFAIDIEFRDGYVSFFEHLHAVPKEAAWKVLEAAIEFMDSNVYRHTEVADPLEVLDRYLGSKVVDKVLDTAAASKAISQLTGYDHLWINGERVLNFPAVVERIRTNEQAMRDLTQFADGPIHGDLTIDNMMVDPRTGEFMLIDPNDENLISDPVVDYGKLLQSLHSGYEFLVMHDVVEVDRDRISFEERKSAHYEFLYERCLDRFASRLSPARFRSLLFHEAVHYCRMLTYRANINPRSVALFYAVAVRLFNRYLAQYPDSLAIGAGADAGADADLGERVHMRDAVGSLSS